MHLYLLPPSVPMISPLSSPSSSRVRSLLRRWLACVLMLTGVVCARAAQDFFVAPQPAGDGRGTSAANAAGFRDRELWARVDPALEQGPVTVTFLAGVYLVSSDKAKALPPLTLTGIGHDTHQFVIQGIKAGAVVFTCPPDDRRTGEKGPGFLFLSDCHHGVVRNLTFTAPQIPIGYATNFGKCQHLLIEDCHWHDLQGVYFGATGTTGAATDHITFRNCRFERVGSGGHAHMAYNAYDPRHIRFIDCTFEDCAGDYIRFRDNTEYGVVTGCTFRSTGTYTNVHAPFISVPLFNDDNPASNPAHPNYEYFGTHFLIFNNTFIYASEAKPEARIAVLFHQSGYSPPGRHYLLTPAEARILKTGTTAAKQALLRDTVGINPATLHVYGNTYTRVAHRGVFRSAAQYGAKSLGGDGFYDIGDTYNATPVVKTAAEALEFFK